MKKLFLAATICTLVCAFPAYGAGVSFEHARALMLERADMLKISQADIEQRQQQVKESRSLSGPKISLNAQQVEGRKDINMSFDNPLAGAGLGQIGQALPPAVSCLLYTSDAADEL